MHESLKTRDWAHSNVKQVSQFMETKSFKSDQKNSQNTALLDSNFMFD